MPDQKTPTRPDATDLQPRIVDVDSTGGGETPGSAPTIDAKVIEKAINFEFIYSLVVTSYFQVLQDSTVRVMNR